jgi:uncharacterized cofD-like protein
LKNHPGNLSVIVTVTDDGGSSGRLREELGSMPPGDIRNCMIALSEDETLMSQLFRFRFSSRGELHGHSFGNLFLAAMAGVTGDFAKAVQLTSEVLAIKGVIYPSTNSHVALKAEMENGEWIEGETRITQARGKIRRIALQPGDAKPLAGAIDAILEADIITIGPGSLYTSLIPNLLVEGIIPAIERSNATKIYIQNIMTQPGETVGMSASCHMAALASHCNGSVLFPHVLLNNRMPAESIVKNYHAEGAGVVEVDRSRLAAMGYHCVERDLLAEDVVIRHDPGRLARAIHEISG